jgi:uncharacterized protein
MTSLDACDFELRWPCATDPEGDGGSQWAVRLMPERAVFTPHNNTLFVADIHLGKAAVFRARGVPVPQGTTTVTLARLSAALHRSQAMRLIVLGDLLHAKESQAAPTLEALRAWRSRHPHLNCGVLEGNHDRHAGSLPESLGFTPLGTQFQEGLLRGVHELAGAVDPSPLMDGGATMPLTLAGHVHPVVHLRTRFDHVRLPCFWLRGSMLTLPAFGEFTGGHAVERDPASASERIFVVAESVMEYWPGRIAGRSRPAKIDP